MKLKYISWLPALIIMVIIFNVTDTSYEGLVEYQVLYEIDHIIRKSAHFIEYACLAVAIFFHFTVLMTGIRAGLGLSILITAVYAATDEFHQTFVNGRSGQISDVLLDSCGAAAGAVLFLLLLAISRRRMKKL
ncbi:MAG: hypothetical protein K0R34_2370 [Herbinix sp.]|nr:hypothetical protein [Herbinix sp.]